MTSPAPDNRVKQLLPVLADQLADELDAVADTWDDNVPGFRVVQQLRARAEALRRQSDTASLKRYATRRAALDATAHGQQTLILDNLKAAP